MVLLDGTVKMVVALEPAEFRFSKLNIDAHQWFVARFPWFSLRVPEKHTVKLLNKHAQSKRRFCLKTN